MAVAQFRLVWRASGEPSCLSDVARLDCLPRIDIETQFPVGAGYDRADLEKKSDLLFRLAKYGVVHFPADRVNPSESRDEALVAIRKPARPRPPVAHAAAEQKNILNEKMDLNEIYVCKLNSNFTPKNIAGLCGKISRMGAREPVYVNFTNVAGIDRQSLEVIIMVGAVLGERRVRFIGISRPLWTEFHDLWSVLGEPIVVPPPWWLRDDA